MKRKNDSMKEKSRDVAACSEDFLSATTEINAGIACSDRANEVEPRPNEDCFKSAHSNNQHVISKEERLKQPSLRARRSQSRTLITSILDCFIALAIAIILIILIVLTKSWFKG